MELLLLHPIDEKPCHLQARSSSMRVAEKKRSTSEKNFSLDVLRKYFSGSLRDAAMSLGGEPYCIVMKSQLNLNFCCDIHSTENNAITVAEFLRLVYYEMNYF